MSVRKLRRFLRGPVLGPALALACAVLLIVLLLRGGTPVALVLALAAALSPLALAGLYRPFGAGSLGLGAFVAPLALATAGPAVGAWAVAGGAFLCATVRYRLLRPAPAEDRGTSRDRRGALRRATDALGLAGAATAASLPLLGAGPGTAQALERELFSVLLFAAGARLVERLPALGRLPHDGDPPWPREVLGALWDGLGWALGLALVRLLVAGWPALLPAVLALAGLGAVAGAQAARTAALERDVGELERLVALGNKPAPSGQESVASRIQREIAAVIDYEWLEVRLLTEFDHPPVLSAERAGPLTEGPARPTAFPPPPPGISRRRPWLVLERELSSRARGFGTIKLWCDPRKVSAPAVERLDRLVAQLGGQVELVWLEREAAEDPLTRLVRRGVLEERMRKEFARCRDDGATLALVVLDLDRFKAINDRWGHLAGDRALSHVASVLLAQLGAGGPLCCRWGGEEFVVLLPDATGDEALEAAERLRLAVAAVTVEVDGGVIAPTISAGVAAAPELVVQQPEDLFEFADRALYAAKAAGRDRCLRAIGPNRYRGVDGAVYGEAAPPKAAPML